VRSLEHGGVMADKIQLVVQEATCTSWPHHKKVYDFNDCWIVQVKTVSPLATYQVVAPTVTVTMVCLKSVVRQGANTRSHKSSSMSPCHSLQIITSSHSTLLRRAPPARPPPSPCPSSTPTTTHRRTVRTPRDGCIWC